MTAPVIYRKSGDILWPSAELEPWSNDAKKKKIDATRHDSENARSARRCPLNLRLTIQHESLYNMNSTSVFRLVASKAMLPKSIPAATAQKCTATTRWYATAGSRTPKTSAATKKKTTTAKTSSKTFHGEEESIAARTPLRKPSTTGLGVPGKSPSAPPRPTPSRSSTGKPVQPISPGAVPPTVGDAAEQAERRESQLRTARFRRVDREAQQAAKEEAERTYKQRYDGAARKWVSGIIAMPILIVTSWYLFDRRESVGALVGERRADRGYSCVGEPAQAHSQGGQGLDFWKR